VNLTYSDIAREYLLREGLPPDLVIKTGSPMFEVLTHYRDAIDGSDVLGRLGLNENNYFVVSAHREENIEPERNFAQLVCLLNELATRYAMPIILSTHPRTRKRIEGTGTVFPEEVQLLKPLGFTDYNRLQLSARAVLSDSGTISEEAAILNFPALNLREQHERPEGMEETAAMLVGLEPECALQALAILADQPRGPERLIRLPADYAMPNVSDKVVRIIQSYTAYVNRVIWKRY
jgi:UDP-N-acetylglucosamine 2-epimerase (non-hydrolysing)